MKTSIIIALATVSFLATAAFAKPNMNMTCNVSVISSNGHREALAQADFNTNQDSVELFGQPGEVAAGYERYGVMLTNTSKGMILVLLDGKRVLAASVKSYEFPSYTIRTDISNLKFDQLELNCDPAAASAQ